VKLGCGVQLPLGTTVDFELTDRLQGFLTLVVFMCLTHPMWHVPCKVDSSLLIRKDVLAFYRT